MTIEANLQSIDVLRGVVEAYDAYAAGKFVLCSAEDAHRLHGLDTEVPLLCWGGAYVEDGTLIMLGQNGCLVMINLETKMVDL